jgi:septal ring factor EnvC (AmiA/AmiB activator)
MNLKTLCVLRILILALNCRLTYLNNFSVVSLVFLLSQASQDEATKAKDILANELKCLREELKQIRDDRDRQLGQVQSLTGEVAKYKEYTGKSSEQLGTLTAKTSALEEVCTSQRQQMDMLQQQLNAEKEKLKVLSWTDVYMCVLCFSLY